MNSLNQFINKKAVTYYAISVFLTIGGFLTEFMRGLKSEAELILLLAICLVPFSIAIIKYKKSPEKRSLTTFIGIAFTMAYVYILLTFDRLSIYSLVLVMLPILTLNASKKSIYMFALMVMSANIARIVMQYNGMVGSGFDAIEHFIQLALIVLVFICNISTNTASLLHNKQQVDALHNEKANQKKAISKTKAIINIVRGYSVEFSDHVGNLTEHSKDVSQMTNSANESAFYGSKVVERISENSNSVSNSSAKVGKAIEELKVRVEKINQTINVISKISKEINLISLNAAVESARSGEAGLGFAVVADEIKSLANQTAEATMRIDEIIKELNSDVEYSMQAMVALEEINGEQNMLIEDVASTYSKINNSMGNVTKSVNTMNEMITSVSDSNQKMLESMEE